MATVLVEEAALSTAQEPTATPTANATLGPRWLAPLVLVAAIVLAVFVFAWFCDNSRYLWWWINHDRHTHYMNGLNLAYDAKTGDVARLWHDFDRMRVWGPFHPVAVGVIQLVAGPDHRLAVLPSVVGWIMAIWFAFLIPRRILSSGGNAAGLIAAFMVALSPAHRAFATDCMYESLGAGFSLAAIYFYLAAVQDQSPRFGIALGLTLTAMFLHKYNYWLLVLFGMLAGEFARQPRAWCQYAWSLFTGGFKGREGEASAEPCNDRQRHVETARRESRPSAARIGSRIVGELKQPLNYIALALGAAAAYVVVTGGGVITIAGRHVSFQEPHNLVHLAYVALFVRALLWWRNAGSAWSRTLEPTLRSVLLWHGGAIALWFLLPKRLSYFLWYLSPANTDQHRESVPFMHGFPYYLQGLADDYLTLSWGVYLFAGMLLLGVLCWRGFKPGSAALFFFFLISMYLTCQHPMLKNRFMHSWIAVGWIIGTAGLVYAVQGIARTISERWQPWSAAGVCALLIGLHGSTFLEPGHAQEGGIKRDYACPLVIPDAYLPSLADAKEPTLFANVSIRFMLSWTFIEHHHHQRFNADIKNYQANFENNPEQIQRWLKATRSDTLVVIDVQPGSKFFFKTDEYVDLSALKQVLAQQPAFSRTQQWDLPDGIVIALWKKK